ncbi:uncharacterized protein N7479_009562 [Penicillium vulpinum]|uniref:uncharacterized protein n=1 Tax=Penicillium vulpinum TaxID=29845 RepID=UPI0025471B8B|nr:uncharacterized protein N7479_009562 [Penicillium vulpinum]KAJ5951149.1 hypothetical protein N7479_009562 [Penicillium vulpinum]
MFANCMSSVRDQNEPKAESAQGVESKIPFRNEPIIAMKRKRRVMIPIPPSMRSLPRSFLTLPGAFFCLADLHGRQFNSQRLPKTFLQVTLTWTGAMGGLCRRNDQVGVLCNPKMWVCLHVLPASPGDSMTAKRPLTLHQPHGPNIERYQVLTMARQLRTSYRWGEDTFRIE